MVTDTDVELAATLNIDDGPKNAEPKRPITIGDNFVSAALMVTQAKKDTHLNEQTLVKILELQMMWELNNRQTPRPMFDPEEMGVEGPVELPTPDEYITTEDEA